jgi:chromate reductase
VNILGFCGSLRKDSFNRKLLLAAEKCLPEGVRLEDFNCGDVPLYNGDLDGERKPEPVARLLEAVRRCDALLFASPEYNHSIPGVLKNVIDWASRPAYASVMVHKPAGIISGSKSLVGGARMQSHLRQVLGSTLARIYPSPEFIVPQVQEKFDAGGRLVDPDIAGRLQKYISGFVIWAGRVSVL